MKNITLSWNVDLEFLLRSDQPEHPIGQSYQSKRHSSQMITADKLKATNEVICYRLLIYYQQFDQPVGQWVATISASETTTKSLISSTLKWRSFLTLAILPLLIFNIFPQISFLYTVLR